MADWFRSTFGPEFKNPGFGVGVDTKNVMPSLTEKWKTTPNWAPHRTLEVGVPVEVGPGLRPGTLGPAPGRGPWAQSQAGDPGPGPMGLGPIWAQSHGLGPMGR